MPRASTKVEDGFNRPFAVRLRLLLEKYNISQKDLAEGLGVTRQAINTYTLGTTVPDIDRLVQIADFFNVSYDYLLGKTLSEKRENTDIVNELGLSDAAIQTLKHYRQLQLEGQPDKIKFVNSLLESNYGDKLVATFSSVIDFISYQVATPPETKDLGARTFINHSIWHGGDGNGEHTKD